VRAAGRLGLALVLVLLATPREASAHGGLPVSQYVLSQSGDPRLYVPVVYWGLWIGDGKGPWTWICEEEINTNRNRRFAVSADGTFYVTDVNGLELSGDRGCTWTPFSGAPLKDMHTSDIDVDPVDGATAYVTTDSGATPNADGGVDPPANGVYVTHDHGTTFVRAAALAAYAAREFSSVRVAPSDPHRIYVTSGLGAVPLMLHVSTDSGASYTARPIAATVDGAAPYKAEILAVDPRAPDVLYLRLSAIVGGTNKHALLRTIDAGVSVAQLAELEVITAPSGMTRGIDGVAVDVGRGRVFVATAGGVLAGDDPGGAPSVTLTKTGNLSQAQCVAVRGGSLYACSSAFSPDFAALARSDDGGQTFVPVLEYADTKGVVDYCAKGTPVADKCPDYWRTYGAQLGVNFSGDAGVDGGGGPGGSCQCHLGARVPPLPLAGVLLALALTAALARRLRR
jgi:hypothetical protein